MSAGNVQVVGIEVSQAIQNLANAIPLIEGKSGIVRVYVETRDLPSDTLVKGTLRVVSAGKKKSIDSIASLHLRAGGQPGVNAQRQDWGESLNFYVAPDLLKKGPLALQLAALTPVMSGDTAPAVDPHQVDLQVQSGFPLRIRAVGLRVRDPKRNNTVDAPAPASYRALRSLLERAFPASKIAWSEATLDAPPGFAPPYPPDGPGWQSLHDLACAEVMKLRALEVGADDVDHRTLYYAMVYHPVEFLVGAVSNLPGTARTDIVGVGPATGDGHYSVHELGHELGCLHPGGQGQSKEDPNFPDPEGRISTAQANHFGIDPGDGASPPQLLPWKTCYDLMTYREPQWVSAYHYQNMMGRIAEVDALGRQPGDFLQVIGTYSLEDDADCRIVGAVSSKLRLSPAPTAGSKIRLEARDNTGKVLFGEAVEQKNARALDLPQDSGAFQVSVPKNPKIKLLVLLVDGRAVVQHPI